MVYSHRMSTAKPILANIVANKELRGEASVNRPPALPDTELSMKPQKGA